MAESGSSTVVTPGIVFWDWDVHTDQMTWSGTVDALFPGRDGPVSLPRSAWVKRVAAGDRPVIQSQLDAVLAGTSSRVDLRYRVDVPGRAPIDVLDRVFAIRKGAAPRRLIGTIKFSPPDQPESSAQASPLVDQLRHSETRFHTFIEFLPLLAWETDSDGWIFYYNQRWYDYTGTTPEQMEGWGWISVHDPADLPRMLRVFRTALLTGQPWEDEFRLRRADGQMRWHLSRAMPLRDASGAIVRWFGTNTDIHDQKMMLAEREQLLKAEQLLRLEAERANQEKDEFVAMVSHELRSPLNVVLGWAQMLRGDQLDAANRAKAAEKIEANARFLGQLINDLLDVSRIVTGKLAIERTPIDVAVAVDGAIEAARATADAKRIPIDYDRPPDPMIVLGSSERLQQIFTNLLINAVKFSPRSSRVEVTTTAEDGRVRVTVTDQGEGIAPEFLPHLFDKFQQADSSSRRRHGGLGLGLAIVKHLAELHGGAVTAHSDGHGKGATFTVTLPESTATANKAKAQDKPATIASLVGIKVLAVDDEPDARDVLASLLLSCGATVTVVSSVAEAFSALRIQLPDVIVSDITMPEVDGYGLMDRLQQSTDARIQTLPVVALTAAAGEDARVRALSRGFTAYLTKPSEATVLSHAILDIVRQRMLHPTS